MIRFVAQIDGVIELDRAFNRVDQVISDFRSIWPNVAKEFYGIEQEQFASEGAHGASGKWAPLSPAYKNWKETHFPGEPILKREHSLYESLTSPDGLASVFRPERDQLTIGSNEPYATAHQRGGRLPRRPPISLTGDDKRRITKAIQIGLVKFTRQAGFKVDERLAA
jgi:phage gpG-like protein